MYILKFNSDILRISRARNRGLDSSRNFAKVIILTILFCMVNNDFSLVG